jgi:hypothetical protein
MHASRKNPSNTVSRNTAPRASPAPHTQSKGARRTAPPAQPPRSDALREDVDPEATVPNQAAEPNLMFNTPRAPLDSDPDQHLVPPPGAATLTSHLNDPAMRRRSSPAGNAQPGPRSAHQSTPRSATGPTTQSTTRSDVSPLARDAATPADELARLAQEASAADLRGRRSGMEPRGDVEKWHQAEENRQSDLPGSPRKDLPE